MPSRLTRGFADTSVGQVHYRAAKPQGAVSTRPLVMFHGSPSSSRSLARLVACLGDQRCVIAFDTMDRAQRWSASAAVKENNAIRSRAAKWRSFLVEGPLH